MTASSDRRFLRELATRCRAALQMLLEAYTNAQNAHVDIWTFAVEIKDLRPAGLANHDLRWLALNGYVEHAAETTAHGKDHRTFRQTGPLTVSAKTCVVLTETGAAWVGSIGKARRGRAKTPFYDSENRELRVGSLVVKRFGQLASSQELIVLAFQEQRWRRCIDDPLPPKPGISPKKHLHDTIKNLNRYQKHSLIRFYGDGTGRRICWGWRR